MPRTSHARLQGLWSRVKLSSARPLDGGVSVQRDSRCSGPRTAREPDGFEKSCDGGEWSRRSLVVTGGVLVVALAVSPLPRDHVESLD